LFAQDRKLAANVAKYCHLLLSVKVPKGFLLGFDRTATLPDAVVIPQLRSPSELVPKYVSDC
jgi:hypothetical protein